MVHSLLKRHIKELKKRKPPLLTVDAVISKDEEVLLIKRGNIPIRENGWCPEDTLNITSL